MQTRWAMTQNPKCEEKKFGKCAWKRENLPKITRYSVVLWHQRNSQTGPAYKDYDEVIVTGLSKISNILLYKDSSLQR